MKTRVIWMNGIEWRDTPTIRELPVRDLTPGECRRLLVHCHPDPMPKERRKAYLLRSTDEPENKAERWSATGHPELYFKPNEQAALRTWIENE